MTFASRLFWRQTAERALKTAAQSTLVGIGMSDTGPVNAFEFDWGLGVGFAVGGAVLSVLTSIASRNIGDVKESPSVV